ncbi:PREDICTED: UPF0235 protein C15orf40 homolog [Calidris pugnax]|uniref:UPF0235 protein C15orf40 homolog n=1 Tax=Calidris pugnax TaxID=198806 RepID=UPI00071C903D|nr:PREDICTED: UPF0235 protein C15orf40 homolog [Calidris pugnax]
MNFLRRCLGPPPASLPPRAAPLSRGGAPAAPGLPAPPGGATGPAGSPGKRRTAQERGGTRRAGVAGSAHRAMLALAGFRRPLAAPVRGGGGAMPRKGKGAGKDPPGAAAAAGPVAAGEGCVRVAVRAKPGARLSAVTDVTAEAVGVAIAAPPTEGEANAELCRYLSKVLEVKKSEVILEKGGKSREKVVKILVSMTPDEILEKLKKEASS